MDNYNDKSYRDTIRPSRSDDFVAQSFKARANSVPPIGVDHRPDVIIASIVVSLGIMSLVLIIAIVISLQTIHSGLSDVQVKLDAIPASIGDTLNKSLTESNTVVYETLMESNARLVREIDAANDRQRALIMRSLDERLSVPHSRSRK